MLTPDDLTRMLSQKPTKRKSTSSRCAIIRTENGLERVPMIEIKAADLGNFVGKVGSMRRSRKGRSYRAPNGSRRYLHGDGIEVVAYKV